MNSIKVDVTYPDGRTRNNLCNGDKLVFKITYNENYAKNLGVTLVNEEYTYEVSGLTAPQTFNLLDYYEVIFTGYDGYGHYEVTCKESVIKDLGSLTVETKEGSTEFYIHIDSDGESWTNTYYVRVETDAWYDLNNGDKVTLLAGYLETEQYIEHGVLFTEVSKEVEVSGLKEAEEIDLLSNYEMKFTGLNGSGSATLVPKQETITVGEYSVDLVNRQIKVGDDNTISYWFSISSTWSLTNGDEITVTLDYSEDTFASYGITVTEDTMEVTVAGLGAYATELTPIKNASNFEDVSEAGETLILDYLYDDWNYAVHNSWKDFTGMTIGEDMALYKTVLVTPKSSSSWTKNTLWLIYSVTLDDDSMDATMYYFAVKYTNVPVMGDGTVDISDCSYNYYKGYTDYQELYDDYIGADTFKNNIYE